MRLAYPGYAFGRGYPVVFSLIRNRRVQRLHPKQRCAPCVAPPRTLGSEPAAGVQKVSTVKPSRMASAMGLPT